MDKNPEITDGGISIAEADYCSAIDAVRAEGESLISHQPNGQGCVAAGQRLVAIADRMLAAKNAAAAASTNAPDSAVTGDSTDGGAK